MKNNLQTVAALLRLQARRLQAPEARAALEEAVRRVGSIAIVHETLSHAPEEIVDFDDIADRVAMMAGEVSSPEVRVTPKITGQFGMLPAPVATPLAMVLTELLQNALQHGFGRAPRAGGDAGIIEVVARACAGAAHRDGDATAAPGCRPDSIWRTPRASACRSSGRWWRGNSAAGSACAAGRGRHDGGRRPAGPLRADAPSSLRAVGSAGPGGAAVLRPAG